jgi:hypothetical protein
MITADVLQTLTTFTTEALSRAVSSEFTSSKFLGMTNGGEFCYQVHWEDEYGSARGQGKVFLKYNPTEGRVSATIG